MPGVIICITIALATSFISDHYGGPTMLYALLFGMTLHFLREEGRCLAGVEFASRTILRLGVALLGGAVYSETVSGTWHRANCNGCPWRNPDHNHGCRSGPYAWP